ncbi:hypothetical protein ACJX0J_037696, partial [Zea mays]
SDMSILLLVVVADYYFLWIWHSTDIYIYLDSIRTQDFLLHNRYIFVCMYYGIWGRNTLWGDKLFFFCSGYAIPNTWHDIWSISYTCLDLLFAFSLVNVNTYNCIVIVILMKIVLIQIYFIFYIS